MRFINEIVPYIDDFFFTSLTDISIRDTIVICNPQDAVCEAPAILRSKKTLAEHISFVNERNIKKALIIAESIEFITACPGLEYLWIIPAVSANNFDYSPLYQMPNLKWLQCQTFYGKQDEKSTVLDYSKFNQFDVLSISGKMGHHNLNKVLTKTLYCNGEYPATDTITGCFSGQILANLSILQSPIRSLSGIDELAFLKKLYLGFNRRLTDISALESVKESLIWLEIENCGKIQDFSVLAKLSELQRLELKGANKLENLDFLKRLPKLKYLVITMNILDGNLKNCLCVPYARIQNRKHYNLKDIELKKQLPNCQTLVEFDQ